MAKTLNAQIHERITELSAQGDIFCNAGDYIEAHRRYAQALQLLPEPEGEWEAATWLLAAIGDCLFRRGQFERARDAFSDAVACPSGLGNPFIHLRLGQTQLEMGAEGRAADELARAFMGAGIGIFEDEDPKYLAFLKTKLSATARGAGRSSARRLNRRGLTQRCTGHTLPFSSALSSVRCGQCVPVSLAVRPQRPRRS